MKSRWPPVRNQATPESSAQLPPARPLRLRVGEAGEAAACAYLRAVGYGIVQTDWRCRLGQIDIVAEIGSTLVVVEVKARRGTGFGLPQESVDGRKQQKLRALTAVLMQQSPRRYSDVRIDVVAILLDADLQVRGIDHIIDAVGG